MMSNAAQDERFPNYSGALKATMNPLKIHPSLKNERLLCDYIVANDELLRSRGVIKESGEMGPFMVNVCLEHGLDGLYADCVS